MLTDREKASFAPMFGSSLWRENIFVGGFPGGEEAFNDWVDCGARHNVPDLPDFLQPHPKQEKPQPKKLPGLTDLEKKSFAPMFGKSQWRENIFVGGFPGGEEAFMDWVDCGAKHAVPDLPDYLQPRRPRRG